MLRSLLAKTYPTTSLPARISGESWSSSFIPRCSNSYAGTKYALAEVLFWKAMLRPRRASSVSIPLSRRTKNSERYWLTPPRLVDSNGIAAARRCSSIPLAAVSVTQCTRPRRR